MNLRTLRKSKGFYSMTNKNIASLQQQKEKIRMQRVPRSELKALNFIILKNLRTSSKRSPIVNVKMEMTNYFKNYLIKMYQLTTRFIDGTSILIDHSLHLNRFLNPHEYYALKSFQIRLVRPKRLNVILDNLMNKKCFFFKNKLHIKFIVIEKKAE